MALWDTIKGQLRSVIQWENASSETLFELWSNDGDEIKNASKLIINPGQGAIFVYQGKIQAVHKEEGTYELKTDNIPFITTISKFMQRFESEHKVGVYFFWQTEIVNQKWGTLSPIKYDDPIYKFPVGLRAHGNYSFKISNPESLFVNIIGSKNNFTAGEARRIVVERFSQQLADALACASFSYAEVDKNRVELSQKLKELIIADFAPLGFELTDFRIEGTDFDEETQARVGKIADFVVEAEAAKRVGLSYAEIQQLQALRDAAKNEGGAAGAGVSLGAGLGLAQAMASQAQSLSFVGGAAKSESSVSKLEQLKTMLDKQLISSEEYEKKKAEILSSL